MNEEQPNEPEAEQPTPEEELDPIQAELRQLGYVDLWDVQEARDGAARLLRTLPERCPPETVVTIGGAQRAWELCGNYYRVRHRPHEALAIFEALYFQMLTWQRRHDAWTHKAMPLVWMRDCHAAMGHPALAKRYSMLTLFDDAIGGQGVVPAETTGIYFRLVWGHGLSDSELKRYAGRACELFQHNPKDARFPEWILQEVDQEWMQEYPSAVETAYYRANPLYIRYLVDALGEPTGRVMERLADYLLSVIPGCRTYRRKKSGSTDYDVIFTLEGHGLDFRADLGRYAICECKDWNKPVSAAAISRFCKTLQDAKCRFGITFAREGLTGHDKAKNAELELIKTYQAVGMIVIVIDREDLEALAAGASLISMLRSRYEKVLLNLVEEGPTPRKKRKVASGRRRSHGHQSGSS